MFLTLLLFFIGFYILVKGANLLIEGSSSLAQRFKISGFVIGLVIVGIGTSIPEFAITFIANLTGEEGIGLGTVIGSNTFNILVILGLAALPWTLPFRQEWVSRDLLWNILAVLAAAFFAAPFSGSEISRIEGLVLLIFFGLWLRWVIVKTNHMRSPEEKPLRILVLPMALLAILAGLAGVLLGGKWVVDGAEVMARELGMSEALIGLTIVGIGTSLPELTATFAAVLNRQPGIAVGNVIGSNIFDFLFILGAAAVVKPIDFPPRLFTDIYITLLSAAALYAFMFIGKRNVLKRWQGLLFIVFYAIYLIYLFGRG